MGGQEHGNRAAVMTFKIHFVINDLAVPFNHCLKFFPVLRPHIKVFCDIHVQEFRLTLIPQHGQKGLVCIQEFAFLGAHVYTTAYMFKQSSVILFGSPDFILSLLSLRDIPTDV